jgi:hypothetical protein
MFLRLIWLIAIAITLIPSGSHAAKPYFEMGAGAAQIRGAEEFFGGSTPDNLDFGATLNFTLAVNFGEPRSPAAFHFGLQHRYISGAGENQAFAMQASYPILRIEIQKFFITLGATPFMWKRAQTTAGLDAFSMPEASLAALVELGGQWAITPSVAFVLAMAGQTVRSSEAGFSPKLAIEGNVALRFYFGKGGTEINAASKSYGSGGMGEYNGFRYPYGMDSNY